MIENNSDMQKLLYDDIIVRPMFTSEPQNSFNVYEICSNGTCTMKLFSVKDLYAFLTQENVTKPNIENCDELNLRDLRRLDYKLNPDEEAVIFVRKHIVVFSIDTTRAIITADKLFFIIPNGVDSMLEMLGRHMNTWNSSSNIHNANNTKDSFENHAYDGLLLATKFYDELCLNRLKTDASDIVTQLKKKSIIPLKLQEKLKELKNKLAERLKHFNHIKQALNDLLDDDEKMAMMNLTAMKIQPHIFQNLSKLNIHEKTESLIEVHLYDFNGLLSEVELLSEKIKHSEEFALFRLSSVRNQLMIVNTVLSILTSVIGFCAYITGLFGMNLDNVIYLQPIHGMFTGVLVSTLVLIPITTIAILTILNKYNYVPL